MDAIQSQIFSSKDKRVLQSASISDLSPVTNLTLNLCGLSTSATGTPIRRISWANPIPEQTKMGFNADDFSSNESPTFQEVFSRRTKLKHRARKIIPKALPSDSDEEKENVSPSVKPVQMSVNSFYEESIQCSSQDSGYSGVSESCYLESPSSSQPFTRNYFMDEDEDHSLDNIFILEEIDDISSSPVCKNMHKLLNSPLSKNHKSPRCPPKPRFQKLPIRRCLSMDIDSESEISSTESSNLVTDSVTPHNNHRDLDVPGKTLFKRPEPPNNYPPSYSKRRKSCASVEPHVGEIGKESFTFQRSYSETAATIMHALLKADLQPELIGDGSRSYALPLVKGRHQDLKSISPETLSELLKGNYRDSIENFVLIDCRYPYEFEGGHIQGAKNIFTKEDLISTFLEGVINEYQNNALIFHCEFSSERAPTLCRFLRNKDRELNEGNYPRLHHPEIYILEGGYKAFFENYKEFCEPQGYKPMNHKDHGFELRHFRAKSKSLGADSKSRYKFRSGSKHTCI